MHWRCRAEEHQDTRLQPTYTVLASASTELLWIQSVVVKISTGKSSGNLRYLNFLRSLEKCVTNCIPVQRAVLAW